MPFAPLIVQPFMPSLILKFFLLQQKNKAYRFFTLYALALYYDFWIMMIFFQQVLSPVQRKFPHIPQFPPYLPLKNVSGLPGPCRKSHAAFSVSFYPSLPCTIPLVWSLNVKKVHGLCGFLYCFHLYFLPFLHASLSPARRAILLMYFCI